MKTVLDFNGFFDVRGVFHIKEYALCSLDRMGGKLNHLHEVLKPLTRNFDDLDAWTRESFLMHYQRHKISWETRTYQTGEKQPEVPYFLVKSNLIFVADRQKENLFLHYLESCVGSDRLQFNFLRLQDVGYKVNHQKTLVCFHHSDPKVDDCADDNVLDMVRFVRAKHLFSNYQLKLINVAIDFNFHGSGYTGIKELAVISIGHNGDQIKKKLEVTKPASFLQPNWYESYYKKYGIKWRSGSRKFKHLRFNLSKTLNQVLFVFVKDRVQKEVLCNVNENARSKIVCLEEFGYNPRDFERTTTTCAWHDNPLENNCAYDNANAMAEWLKMNRLFNKSKRDSLEAKPASIQHNPLPVSRMLASPNRPWEERTDPVGSPDSSSLRGNPGQLAAQFYESFGSTLTNDSRQLGAISSKNEDSDSDFEVYLDRNDPRFLVFDPKVFDVATDELVKEDNDFWLENLLGDGESSPDVMDDFDAEAFQLFIN